MKWVLPVVTFGIAALVSIGTRDGTAFFMWLAGYSAAYAAHSKEDLTDD